MTVEEIKECEGILLGEGKILPEDIDSDLLCHKILGFEDMEGTDEQEGYEGEEELQWKILKYEWYIQIINMNNI